MAKYDIGVATHATICKCGGSPVLWTETGTNDFFVECDSCGEYGPWDNAFQAIQRWNGGQREKDD